MFIAHMNDFFIGGALNFASVDANQSVTDGFGGGPYFTSLDEATIAYASSLLPGENILMYRLSLGYDFRSYNSSFEYAYGKMASKDAYIKENDFVYTYNKDEKWQAQVVFASYKTKDDLQSFSRFVARIDYNF
jgi:hypothetical protein